MNDDCDCPYHCCAGICCPDECLCGDDSAPAAVCPTCGRTPTASSTRRSNGVNIGDYRCSAGHIWSTHWPAVA